MTSLKVSLTLLCNSGSSDSGSITLSVDSQVASGIIFSASDAMSSTKETLSNSLKLLVITFAAKSSAITFRSSSRTSTSVALRTLSNSIAKSGINFTALFFSLASPTSCATTGTTSSFKTISATSLKLLLITSAANFSAITSSGARVGTCEIKSQ